MKNKIQADSTDNFDIVSRSLTVILYVCIFAEIFFFPQIENIYGCAVSIYAWILCKKYVFTRYNFTYFLVPSIIIFGYVVSFYILPFVATLLEGKPVTFNFEVPFLTFSNQFLMVTTLMAAFVLCKKVYTRRNFLTRLWRKIGYFHVPSELQIWILGLIGFAALAFFAANQTNESASLDSKVASGDYLSHLISILKPYSTFPLCLLFGRYMGRRRKATTRIFILPYMLLLAIVGIATTRRMLIFNALTVLLLVYAYAVLMENRKILTTKRTIIIAVGFYLLTGPLTDIAAAMSLNRHNLSGSSTFNDVWELYQDKERLNMLKQEGLSFVYDNEGNNSLGWSEYYVDNLFLDRICNVRVMDASLTYAKKLGYANAYMQDYFKQYMINLFPSPIVNSLGFKKVVVTTPQDLMVSVRFGDYSAIGGYRVGGETGIGLALFGYWYYQFAFIVYFLLFYFTSTLVLFLRGSWRIIPLPILASFMVYFRYIQNGYGIFNKISYITRAGWHEIIFYCVLLYIIRILTRKI